MVKSCNRGSKLYRCSYLGHSVDLGRYINFKLWNDSNLPVCTNLRHFFMSLLNPVAHIILRSALKSLSQTSNQEVVSDCLTVRWT